MSNDESYEDTTNSDSSENNIEEIDNTHFNENIINLDSNCFDILAYCNYTKINTKKYNKIYRITGIYIRIEIKTTEKIFIDSLLYTIFLRKLPLSFINGVRLGFCNLIINDILFNLRPGCSHCQLNACLSYIGENKVEFLYEKYIEDKYSLKYSTEITYRQHYNYTTREIKNYTDNVKSPRLDGTKLLVELIKRLNIGNSIQMKFID